ncbi:helix-turn-helix transcriptional regulator [Streptomyces sp. MNU76]|uniref:helix-turn-helix domain-containing protein n=1 Tax=Streptomyces sp. MNU76 TaxID=2560026 RepID=UPI0027E0D006|nr:helix-turn-helix transcriptional regulator [Streptomyces sp. MNU76]
MSAWQPLADELPPEVQHFVEQLRLLKDRTGLSLVALGARTAYSKSSWQRYLNGAQPPPRQAVVALCRVAGEDAARFGALRELALGPGRARPPRRCRPSRPSPERRGAEGNVAEAYEDDPTLPGGTPRRRTGPAHPAASPSTPPSPSCSPWPSSPPR